MDNDNNNNNGAGEGKITFTPEQQERVNELIKDAMGRAGKEAREEAARLREEQKSVKGELEKLQEELKKAAAGGGKASDDELKAEVERIKNLHTEEKTRLQSQAEAQSKEAKQYKDKFEDLRRKIAIQTAAAKHNFVDVNVVMKLTEDAVQWDSERGAFVVMEGGVARMNSSFEPMSLEEYYAEYANKSPYLVRSDARSGNGSSESNASNGSKLKLTDLFGPDSSGKLANELAQSNPAEYRRLREQARQQGLIA